MIDLRDWLGAGGLPGRGWVMGRREFGYEVLYHTLFRFKCNHLPFTLVLWKGFRPTRGTVLLGRNVRERELFR